MRRIALTLILTTLLGLSIPSCTKEKIVTEVVHDTTTKNIAVVFLKDKRFSWEKSYARLYSDPLLDSSQAVLTVNGNIFPEEVLYPGFLYFGYSQDLPADSEYVVNLTSSLGNLTGRIEMPAPLTITSPHFYDTLSGNITVSWNAVQNTDFYEIYCYVEVEDSYGNPITSREFYDFTTQLSYNLSDTLFTGGEYYEVTVYVYPVSGVFPSQGAIGNMTGDLTGFLNAVGEEDYVRFYVGVPAKSRFVNVLPEPLNGYMIRLR